MIPKPLSDSARTQNTTANIVGGRSPKNKTSRSKKSRGRTAAKAKVYVYGPVPSRRLGFSLGVDILPYKTCSLDCIYCQLGPTPRLTTRRRPYFPLKTVLAEIKEKIDSGNQIDHITFSGSGEPTLNASIGRLIGGIKKMSAIPVAVLTNSTLLTDKKARRDILAADVVVPSLDAATEEGFIRINRPPAGLTAKKIIAGLIEFRREYKGRIWLEVMLVKGINDSPSEIRALKEAIARIKPDKVQLNTVVRPPAEDFARPLSIHLLEKIRREMGPGTEVTAEFRKTQKGRRSEDLAEAVLSMVRRRPVSLQDMALSLGKTATAVRISLAPLLRSRKIRARTHRGVIYYEKG